MALTLDDYKKKFNQSGTFDTYKNLNSLDAYKQQYEDMISQQFDKRNIQSEQFNNVKKNISDQQKWATQQANVNYLKAQKALPLYQQASGMAGLGTSPTTMLKMQNNYNTNLNKISQNYQGQQQSLLGEHTSALDSIDNNTASQASSMLQGYLDARNKMADEEVTAYDEKLLDGASIAEQEEYVNSLKYLDEDTKNQISKEIQVEKDSVIKDITTKINTYNAALTNYNATKYALDNFSGKKYTPFTFGRHGSKYVETAEYKAAKAAYENALNVLNNNNVSTVEDAIENSGLSESDKEALRNKYNQIGR